MRLTDKQYDHVERLAKSAKEAYASIADFFDELDHLRMADIVDLKSAMEEVREGRDLYQLLVNGDTSTEWRVLSEVLSAVLVKAEEEEA